MKSFADYAASVLSDDGRLFRTSPARRILSWRAPDAKPLGRGAERGDEAFAARLELEAEEWRARRAREAHNA